MFVIVQETLTLRTKSCSNQLLISGASYHMRADLNAGQVACAYFQAFAPLIGPASYLLNCSFESQSYPARTGGIERTVLVRLQRPLEPLRINVLDVDRHS